MPEGDLHYEGKRQALDALRGYFKQQRRRVYVGTELPIYYPGERRFAPDLLVVLDARQRAEEVHRRQEAERRLAELQSELERLKSRGE